MNYSGNYPILDVINLPADLRKLNKDQLKPLAKELRDYLTHTVSVSGGHFSAGLGTVELTIALHYVFDFRTDRLLWDVGHQCYPHKLLTGRNDKFDQLRKSGGISGPSIHESQYDLFCVGHAGTAIATAAGLARGDALRGDARRVVVGFRPWVDRLAGTHGVGGWVRNDAGGGRIEAPGTSERLDAFVSDLQSTPPPAARIDDARCQSIEGRPAPTFEIVASEPSAERRVSIPADLATCPDCLRELADPADRRYRYPFTNCTNCGPRFSIIEGVPYDRDKTTMRRFTMCPACRT